jgi:DnaK suppressor protein
MQTISKGRNGNGNGNRKYAALEMLLQRKHEALSRRLNQRLDDVSVHTEPEDDAGLATASFATDLALTTLERERQELAEIEAALERVKTGEYGLCENCGNPIREVRLQALPWARLCIKCADAQSDMAAD